MYRMLKATLAAFLLTGGCAAAVSAEPYPMPPEVGTMGQREELADLAREASVESDPDRRVQKLLELRELVDEIARDSDDDSVPAKIAHFLAQTAHIAIVNGDHSRGKGGIGYMPNDVTNMPEYVPAEMVALRMTKPRHWVEGLYPKLRVDSSLAGQMIRAAGGFETRGHPFPNFEHIHEALKRTARNEIVTTPKYDGLIHELFMANRMAALLRLLGTERPAFDGGPAPEDFFAFRREILALEAHHAEAVSRYSRLPRDPSSTRPMPFDETSNCCSNWPSARNGRFISTFFHSCAKALPGTTRRSSTASRRIKAPSPSASSPQKE